MIKTSRCKQVQKVVQHYIRRQIPFTLKGIKLKVSRSIDLRRTDNVRIMNCCFKPANSKRHKRTIGIKITDNKIKRIEFPMFVVSEQQYNDGCIAENSFF